ncbi:ParB/RepB/Spo0J family partition protein [Candidatus Omnitrophota bacterium]
MEKRRALGRGLQALIPEPSVIEPETQSAPEARESILYLNTQEIRPSRYQPRYDFNHDKLQELISSIKEKGVVQPILVRKAEQGYELIAGERRLRAAITLGLENMPAIVKDVDDVNAMELALIENIQRDDLNPIEEAKAYQRLCKEFNFTHEVIAQAVGRDRTSVTNFIRLLNLPDSIQNLILNDTLSMGHARALLSVTDPHKQQKLCDQVVKKGLSVREVEQLVKPHAKQRPNAARKTTDPQSAAVEEELQRILGTRIKIQHGKKRGKLIIEYFSPSDLERIINIIRA